MEPLPHRVSQVPKLEFRPIDRNPFFSAGVDRPKVGESDRPINSKSIINICLNDQFDFLPLRFDFALSLPTDVQGPFLARDVS